MSPPPASPRQPKLARGRQRQLFLLASGLSTAGSFAGLTAKGWLLLAGSGNPLLLALHFAALALPSLLFSAPAGVLTDRIGSETVLIRAQWGLVAASLVGAAAMPLLSDQPAALNAALILSTLLVGVASSYEQTARTKYCALLVDGPEQLAPYLASFSVVFNVGKLVGPPLGGWLMTLTGSSTALAIDSASYLLPIAAVLWLLQPDRSREQRSPSGERASLRSAWRDCGAGLRHVVRFTAMACLVGFFHPALAALMARETLGPSPQSLGLFTSVLAAGSISGGVLLQRCSRQAAERPAWLLGGSLMVTSWGQLGMAYSTSQVIDLLMSFLIGAGTAVLLAGSHLVLQVGAPMALRGRMAALGLIANQGGGGLSALLAGSLTQQIGLDHCLALMGFSGLVVGGTQLLGNRNLRIRSDERL